MNLCKPCTQNCTLRVLVKNSCVHVSIMFVSCNLELLALVEFVPIECVILAVSYYHFFREVIQHLVIQGQGTSSLGFTILLVSYFALPVCLWSIKWRCQGQGWTWWGIWWWRRRGRGREDIFSEEAVALSHYMITFPMWWITQLSVGWQLPVLWGYAVLRAALPYCSFIGFVPLSYPVFGGCRGGRHWFGCVGIVISALFWMAL